MPEPPQEELPEDELGPSKSARKRQMHALQALGESLLALTDKQLRGMPIDNEELLQTIHETRHMRSHGARKRHLQRIGKLMRNIDAQPIEQALQELHQTHLSQTDAFHHLEVLRDDILAAGPSGVELAMVRWPEADRQHLRQLVMLHEREQARNKPPAARRKLFRYLRELQEFYGSAV